MSYIINNNKKLLNNFFFFTVHDFHLAHEICLAVESFSFNHTHKRTDNIIELFCCHPFDTFKLEYYLAFV